MRPAVEAEILVADRRDIIDRTAHRIMGDIGNLAEAGEQGRKFGRHAVGARRGGDGAKLAGEQFVDATVIIDRPQLERQAGNRAQRTGRSEEHTSELQSLIRNPYAVLCLKKKKQLLSQYT